MDLGGARRFIASYVFMTTNGGGVPSNSRVRFLESLTRAPRETINSLVECTEAVMNERSSAWGRESICKESQSGPNNTIGMIGQL